MSTETKGHKSEDVKLPVGDPSLDLFVSLHGGKLQLKGNFYGPWSEDLRRSFFQVVHGWASGINASGKLPEVHEDPQHLS